MLDKCTRIERRQQGRCDSSCVSVVVASEFHEIITTRKPERAARAMELENLTTGGFPACIISPNNLQIECRCSTSGGTIRDAMRSNYLHQLIVDNLRNPNSEFCGLAAEHFEVSAASIAKAFETNIPASEEVTSIEPAPARPRVGGPMPLDMIFDVLNRPGRTSTPHDLTIDGRSYTIPAKPRGDGGGGWQFVALQVFSICLAEGGLTLPYDQEKQRIASLEPGELGEKPKYVLHQGRKHYLYTNKSGKDLAKMASRMCEECGLDASRFKVRFTPRDKV